MNRIYRFGIFECSHPHIGSFVSEMLSLKNEFIGVFDRDPALSGPMAVKYGVPLLTDENEFFALRPEIIGTSAVNSRKISAIEKCASAGIHIMADKPLVTGMEAFTRLKTICDAGRIKVGLMLTERFNPLICGLRRMILDGRMGDLISLNMMKPHKLNESERQPWHFSKTENGGIIIDLLIHDLDLVRWLTGSEIDGFSGYVKKSGRPEYPDFFDSVQMSVRTTGGVIALLEADWRMPDRYRTWGDSRIFCTGTRGKAELRLSGDDQSPEAYGLFISADGTGGGYERIKTERPAASLTEDFLSRIEGGNDCIITKNDILDSTYATLAADRAAVLIR